MAECSHLINYRQLKWDECPTANMHLDKPLFDCEKLSVDRTRRSTSVVLYGSSHIRQLALWLWRLMHNRTLSDPSPAWLQSKAAGATTWEGRRCGKSSVVVDPDDAELAKREWPCGAGGPAHMWDMPVCNGAHTLQVYYQVKTHWHTPDNEAHLLSRLAYANLSKPDFLVTEWSVWSEFPCLISQSEMCKLFNAHENNMRRGNASLLPEVQEAYRRREEDRNYLLDWTAQHFANGRTRTVWMMGSAESPQATKYVGRESNSPFPRVACPLCVPCRTQDPG